MAYKDQVQNLGSYKFSNQRPIIYAAAEALDTPYKEGTLFSLIERLYKTRSEEQIRRVVENLMFDGELPYSKTFDMFEQYDVLMIAAYELKALANNG